MQLKMTIFKSLYVMKDAFDKRGIYLGRCKSTMRLQVLDTRIIRNWGIHRQWGHLLLGSCCLSTWNARDETEAERERGIRKGEKAQHQARNADASKESVALR
jgi:hypothetical protein